jgi:hypothetical protein
VDTFLFDSCATTSVSFKVRVCLSSRHSSDLSVWSVCLCCC